MAEIRPINPHLKPSTRPHGGANTWGPYWDALFPPRPVTPWINFKRLSSGVNVARRLWDQREYLRRLYESAHGTDPSDWPSQHPGVVLDEVLWVAHAACLRCHWLDPVGHSVRTHDELEQALDLARRHEMSDGAFRGDATGDVMYTSESVQLHEDS